MGAASKRQPPFSYYFSIKMLIFIEKASSIDAAIFVIFEKENHKNSSHMIFILKSSILANETF